MSLCLSNLKLFLLFHDSLSVSCCRQTGQVYEWCERGHDYQARIWEVQPSTNICRIYTNCSGPGGSVGIAADYMLDGPVSNPGGDEIFRPSRSALGPPSLLYNWNRVFPGGKMRPGRAADHSPPSSAAIMEE